MSARDELTPEQRAALAEQLGDAAPASTGLLMSFGQSVRDRRDHDHTTQREDWYCLNLAAYMGERVAPVLRRLLDAEVEADRLRAQVAALLAERQSTNAALVDVTLAQRVAEGRPAGEDVVTRQPAAGGENR